MPVEYKDYYKTLGVSKDATAADIKKAYRKLARQYHPDVSKGADGSKKFKAVNEANEVLSDPEKRRKYDELGPRWEQYQQWEQSGRPGGRNPFASEAWGSWSLLGSSACRGFGASTGMRHPG